MFLFPGFKLRFLTIPQTHIFHNMEDNFHEQTGREGGRWGEEKRKRGRGREGKREGGMNKELKSGKNLNTKLNFLPL